MKVIVRGRQCSIALFVVVALLLTSVPYSFANEYENTAPSAPPFANVNAAPDASASGNAYAPASSAIQDGISDSSSASTTGAPADSDSDEDTVPIEAFAESGLIEMVDVPEDSFEKPLKKPRGVHTAAPNFEVQKLVDNGPDSENIVVTIMGDGFTASEQGKFITEAQKVSNYLLSKYPYSSFKDGFNVYAVKVISNQSGAAETPTATVDNYFGSRFYFGGGPERLLYPSNSARVYEILNAYTPKYDMPVILVNSTKYGGGGGSFAALSINTNANEVMVHELGHSFGGLADEYWYQGSEAPNMTRDSNPSTNKWNPWIGYESVGIYQFSESPSWYRPHNNCAMRYLNVSFCEVCATELTKRMAVKTNEAFYGRSNITAAAIKSGATRVGNYTFYGCLSLKDVTITGNVTSIGRYAFLGCTGLTSIKNQATTPQPLISNVFSGVDRSKITLYVPIGKTAAYLNAGWTGFKQIIEETPVTAYTVTYNYSENGGSSATKTSASVYVGAAIDLTPTASKSGWTFVGWNTNSAATTALSSLNMGTSNVTLYAIYKRTLTATLIDYSSATQYSRTASVTIYNKATSGTVTVPVQYTYTGWTARGWATGTAANASSVITSGSYTISGNVTLYGLYQRTLTLSYYANGGSSTPSN
ncbi:MAG: InlB B-repeat-containing protein, partial [Clostridiales Family XIII bacterium]|nr:InlB B-repeat-containing protein [Clostridiales Family XIII bacterium]